MPNFSIQSLYNWYRTSIRNPKYRWWMVFGTLAYIFSPIDIAPDFIPIIGQLDDVVILTLLVSEISQLLIDQVKSRQEATVTADSANSTATTADSANPSATTVDVESVSVN